MNNNYKCSCKEYFISTHSSIFKDGEMINVDKHKKQLKCECEKSEILEFIPKEFTGFPLIGISSKDLPNVIKNRAKQDFKKNVLENKIQLDKKTILE